MWWNVNNTTPRWLTREVCGVCVSMHTTKYIYDSNNQNHNDEYIKIILNLDNVW
jgi:hypothetical protein